MKRGSHVTLVSARCSQYRFCGRGPRGHRARSQGTGGEVTQPQVGTAPGSNSNLYRNLLIGLVGLIVVGLIVGLVVVLTGSDDSASASVRTEPIRSRVKIRSHPHRLARMKRFRRWSRPAR